MELKFKDKLGNIKFLLRDADTVPLDIDKQILDVLKKEDEPKDPETKE